MSLNLFSPTYLNGSVVSFRTAHGRRVFRVVRRRGGCTSVDQCFKLRVYRDGRRVYFRLPSDPGAAKKEAERITAFLQLRRNSLDDAVAKFG
jgi:hypothetical protein